jgi:chromosome segregation ATPase
MEDETLQLKLQYIKDAVDEIKEKIRDFENVNLNIQKLDFANEKQDTRISRLEKEIDSVSESRKRIYERIETLEQKPQKEKADIVNSALKYAGVAVLGGAIAFVLSKLGVLFQ